MLVTRREFLKLVLGAAATLGILRLMSLLPPTSQAELLRPPSAVDEEHLNRLCVRCTVCVQACPTNAIIHAGLEYGLTTLDTPRLDPTAGPCEFIRGRCQEAMRCGDLCPTGALRKANKEEVKIGTVELNRESCLAYLGKECAVCYEMCPVPGAITVVDTKPIFDKDRCVGCATCVYYCPAQRKALAVKTEGVRRIQWSR